MKIGSSYAEARAPPLTIGIGTGAWGWSGHGLTTFFELLQVYKAKLRVWPIMR